MKNNFCIEIDGAFELDAETQEEAIMAVSDAIAELAESKGWTFGGSTSPYIDDETDN